MTRCTYARDRTLRPRICSARLEMSTAEIGLSVRTTNCLEERGIFTVEDLLHCTREDLLSISNFGEKTLEEVYHALETVGFYRQTQRSEPVEKSEQAQSERTRGSKRIERCEGIRPCGGMALVGLRFISFAGFPTVTHLSVWVSRAKSLPPASTGKSWNGRVEKLCRTGQRADISQAVEINEHQRAVGLHAPAAVAGKYEISGSESFSVQNTSPVRGSNAQELADTNMSAVELP